jgi:membrane protease YdiL (CAAX protease family)
MNWDQFDSPAESPKTAVVAPPPGQPPSPGNGTPDSLTARQALSAAIVFACAYVALVLLDGQISRALGFDLQQWVALVSVGVATLLTMAVCDRGFWRIGLAVGGGVWLTELAAGALAAALLILSADRLVAIMAAVHRRDGAGFPWPELLFLFLPAAVHEELLFRGYAYQKLRRWNRGAAIAATSIVFGLLHAGNDGVTALGIVNISLAGVLFCLAYEWRQRLWFPISLHFFWNVLSGPVLGYAVSGYGEDRSLFITQVSGPLWTSGGTFGLEGSLAVTAVEMLALAMVWMRVRNSDRVASVQIGAEQGDVSE